MIRTPRRDVPMRPPTAQDLRARLAEARLMLLFVPELCAPREPLDVLAAVLPHVDVVQVRAKAAGERATPARASWELSRAVLGLARELDEPPLVIVNDRVDVAVVLADEGLAGVHLGQGDTPPTVARERLGPGPLIGLSTHDMAQVALAGEEPVDYLGFGPVHPTATKGYERGLGAERAWVASTATALPLFAIGGIDATNVDALGPLGRAAVGRAILAAPDPASAAHALAERLRRAGEDAP